MNDEIRIFISYAREDQQRVEAIYHALVAAGFHPWLDREHILPGQRWEPIIEQALKRSDFALVCLSATSINKRGFLQKEIKQALEHAERMLEDDVWLIPARLDDCEVPDSLSTIQWVDLFEQHGFDELLRAIEFQLKRLGRTPPSAQTGRSKPQPQTQPKSEPPPKTTDGSIFEFVTVKVDEGGKVINRQTGQARCFIEGLSYDVKLEMVEIAGGEFWMGSTDADAQAAFNDAKRYWEEAKQEWYTNETPRHRVAVSPFFMSKHSVTQAQWMEVMGNLPEISGDLRGDDRPVVMVSWEEAVEFCQELSRRTKQKY